MPKLFLSFTVLVFVTSSYLSLNNQIVGAETYLKFAQLQGISANVGILYSLVIAQILNVVGGLMGLVYIWKDNIQVFFRNLFK